MGMMLLLDFLFWLGAYSAGMVLWLWLCCGVGKAVLGYAQVALCLRVGRVSVCGMWVAQVAARHFCCHDDGVACLAGMHIGRSTQVQ